MMYRKLAPTIGTRWGHMLIVLLRFSFAPLLLIYPALGDSAAAILEASGIVSTEAMHEERRAATGLNQPFAVQYLTWITNCLQGDSSVSFSENTETFGPRMKVNTIFSESLFSKVKSLDIIFEDGFNSDAGYSA